MMVEGNLWAQDPVKCTSTADLVAGDIYYISASDTYSPTASVMGKNIGKDNFPATTFGDAPCELTLGGSATGGWTFSYVDGWTTYYLDPTDKNSNCLKANTNTNVTNYSKFTISFTENGAAEIITKGRKEQNVLQFNSVSEIYSCYPKTQSPVYLYKKTSGTSTPDGHTDASWIVSTETLYMKIGKSATTAITTDYDGILSVSSNNSGIATAAIDGKIITVEGKAVGTTTISITGVETSKYNAINQTINVTVTPLLAENEIFYESFDQCDGKGGNDGYWNGSIASSDYKTDNAWESHNAYGANKCARYGQGSGLGYAITPALGHVCDAILTFKAAAWGNESESTILKLSVIDGGSISQSTMELTKGAWQTYEINLTGLTANSRIKFEGEKASDSRFFLDEVSVVKTEATVTLNAACHDTDGIVYSTYSNASAFIVPEGIRVYEVEARGTSLTLHAYETSATVPGNTGVLVASKVSNGGGSFKVKLTDNVGASILGSGNALRPSGNSGITAEDMGKEGAKKFYRLTMHNGEVFGFWWGAAEGGPFALAANKAYLVIEMSSSSSTQNAAPAMGIVFNSGEATGIKDVNVNPNPYHQKRGCYNLNGQRIHSSGNGVSNGYRGIVIVNGKKVINK